MALRTKDFDYALPQELIAARPLPQRSASRMMVVHRDSGRIEHRMFTDLTTLLRPDDLLVLNDTKVVPARVMDNDGRIELLCLERPEPCLWRCLVRPGKRMKAGRTIHVGRRTGEVVEVCANGDRWIRWDAVVDLTEHGRLALPHYMGRSEEPSDRDRYQTVFARAEGAIAAPTAGLHFTPELLEKLPHVFLTLHTGVGTFRPVTADLIADHIMHEEHYAVSAETARHVNMARRVVAVGTTVTRVLETLAAAGHGEACRIAERDHTGSTDIFIHPPYRFGAVSAMLTNFHLPQSTLIMLVCAFAGKDLTLEAYQQAVAERYRFYSYGDCMLVL